MDNIFAQYCMLVITAFTPFFFFFASIWDGEGMCVRACVCVCVCVCTGKGLQEILSQTF